VDRYVNGAGKILRCGSGTITDGVAFDPATKPMFVRFKDAGVTCGTTSAAVRTQ